MKLWLDDERKAPDRGWKVAKTCQEAISLLEEGEVATISIDHDLGQIETGYDLAVWIEGMAAEGKLKRLGWRVHSANPVGRKRIEQAMESADRFWNEEHRMVE